MATEINPTSVLAKLMGIERPSLPRSPGRQKILSKNYLQNIAFITHRERSPLNFYEDEDEFTMAVDGHIENEDILQLSERTSVDEFNNLGGGSIKVAQSVHVKTMSEGVRYLCQDQRSRQFEGFAPQDNVSLCSELGCLTNPGSLRASTIKKEKSSEVRIWQKKSQQRMETSRFAQNVSKECLEVGNGCCSPSKRIIELNTQNSKSSLPGISSLPNSASGGRKQNISCGRDMGISSRGKKTRNLDNGRESPVEDRKSAREIAKQLASEVKHSIWHSFTDASNSRPRGDKNSANEHEETVSSLSCLSSLDNEHETSSSKPIKKSAGQDVQKIKKEISERWRTRKSDREARTFRGNSDGVYCRVNGCQVGAARYLSKPTLFPSAWVPGSRIRDLNLDSHWCLRSVKLENLQCNNLADNIGDEILRSTLEPSGVGLSSGEYEMRKALRILNDSKKFEESNMSEEVSSAPESSSESSLLPYIESPTYLEALMTLSEAHDMNAENHVFQEGSFRSLLNCTVVPPSMDNEGINDEGNRKAGTYVKLRRKQLSAEATTLILLENRGSSFPELCLKHQVKENSSEPVSPVSSLEGPEACRCWPKPIVESKQISSFPEFLENNIHDFQRKVQPMDTMSLESGSEGPEMAVSTDGDSEGSSVGCYREDSQIMEIHGTIENRDFSYVVDVLSELGFPTLNLEIESDAWCCQGYALNPLVFDSLEKKYGKQTFWERSERKLLFDRMDLGLMEIARSLDPINTQRKPLSKRFGSMQNQELVEEELWALLVKQEEESKRASCTKVCGGEMEWLEIETYACLIVKEVESLILDELVEEFVNMVTMFWRRVRVSRA